LREQIETSFERPFANLVFFPCQYSSDRRIDALSDESGLAPIPGLLRHRNEPPLRADSVEKVGVLTRSNFFSAVGAVFRFGREGPHHPPQTQRSKY
jgi:hypothetical protein